MTVQLPNILLINFTDTNLSLLSNAGFKADLGYIGKAEGQNYLPYYFPRPPYEYDIYVYNSHVLGEKLLKSLFPATSNLLHDTEMLSIVKNLHSTVRLRI